MDTPPPRSRQQRSDDTLRRLGNDVDVWVATADPSTGTPYLVPLSFMWDGTHVLVSTLAASPTSRNLRDGGKARLGFGPTRDLVLMDAVLEEAVPTAEMPDELADAFATRAGFDPREQDEDYLYFRIRPNRIQAWREANELAGRDLMRDGAWLT